MWEQSSCRGEIKLVTDDDIESDHVAKLESGPSFRTACCRATRGGCAGVLVSLRRSVVC